ncbi:MAG: zinc ribbon domain-containing protein [Clostridia bacterium]|nr:zinc ribbon domain-containing protein [Clostridia bacterium]
MNIIEKRTSQFKFISAIILALGVILSVVGIILLVNSGIGKDLSVIKLVFGIILIVLGLAGVGFGIAFSWIGASLKATKGSIAEDNAAKGTVNMNKCENCGAEVEPGVKICAKCEENLKP